MRFELFIAARYLRAKRRQAVIGVITAISVLGVAAGVASLIIALAINNGFRLDMQERLLGSSSHVNLMRVENDGIRDWSALQQRLEAIRAAELEKCLRRVGPITTEQRQAIEMLATQMINKILHYPILRLKDPNAEPQERESLRQTIRKIFGLR